MRKTALLLLAALAAILVLAACQKSVPAPLSSYITDDGDYLSAEQENALQSAILEAREKTESDYIIVFTKNPPTDDSRAAAEQVMEAFRNAGGGYGENQQTIGLYVDMLNRKLFINEYNKAEDYKLSDGTIDAIVQDVAQYMSTDNYYGAAATFVDDAYNAAKPGFFKTIWGQLVSALAGGGAVSGILVGKHKRQPATPKRHYVKQNGVVPRRSSDRFMGTTTEVRHIERAEPSDSGGSSDGNISSSSGSCGNHGGGASF